MNFKGTRLQKSSKSWRGDDFKKFGFLKLLSSLNLSATQSAVIFHRPNTLPYILPPSSYVNLGRIDSKINAEMNFKGTRLQKFSKSWRGDDLKKIGFLKSLSSLNLGATQSAVIFHRPHTLPYIMPPSSYVNLGRIDSKINAEMNFKGTRLQKSSKSWRGDDFKKFGFLKLLSSLNLGATQSAVIFHRPHTLPYILPPSSYVNLGRIDSKINAEMNFKGTRLQKSSKSWRGDDFKKIWIS